MKIEDLVEQIKAQISNDPTLPLGSKAVLQVSKTAELLIVGQAPGSKVHNTGIPWNDASGKRLRSWLALSEEEFYDKAKIALMPIGFCYPGVDKYGGDKPPHVEHAKLWHKPLRALMPNIKFTLLVGSYAQNHYLEKKAKITMSETVKAWKEYMPEFMVLPHPSWRNTAWLKKHTWFETELVPELREYVRNLLSVK